MNALSNEKRLTGGALRTNLLFIAAAELLIYNGGLLIKYEIQSRVDFFTPVVGPDFGLYCNANFWIIIPILLTLLFMGLTCPDALKVFTEGSPARKLKALGKGMALGFLAIGLLTLLATLAGALSFSYNRFSWQLIPAILLLFIQCTAEEMLLRGYVPAVVGEKHSWDVVCFVSGTLFIFHHTLNMEFYGFNTVFCLNAFLLGALFCLLVKWEGNFWIACGIHTAWNYAQTYLFGVSCSGNDAAAVGLFQGALNGDSVFYQEVYGYEGAISATVLALIATGWLIYHLHKRGMLDSTGENHV